MEDALKLGSQGASNVRVDSIVFNMTVARIAAPAVESQTGKVVGFTSMFPRTGANDTVREDPLERNRWAIVNEGVDGLVLGQAEVLGFGVVQLEQQEERIAAWKFAPQECGIAFNDAGHVGDVIHEVAEVIAPGCRRKSTKRYWKEMNELLDGGVHESAG